MRLDDWDQRLRVYLRSVSQVPFAIGRHDCATFTAGCVEAMTGKDYLRGFRGYRTLPEGLRKVQAAGYDDHIALVAAHFEECGPALGQVGDIAVVPGDMGDALGIYQGAGIYCIRRKLQTIPLTFAKRAFRVG